MHENVPDADDVAEGAGEDEEMEDAVGVGAVGAYGIEHGAGDVHNAFGYEPAYGGGADALHQRAESYEDREAHKNVADGLEVAVLLEVDEADYGACYGAEPNETEEAPSPPACVAHGNKGDGAVAAGYVPIDGGVVEAAQHFAGRPVLGQGVVDGGGYVGAEHAGKVEGDGRGGPAVVGTVAPHEEAYAHAYAEGYAGRMRPGVDPFFVLRVGYHGLELGIRD